LATAQSLRRIARLAEKLETDLRAGGMAYPWKSLFRTNAILTRIVAHLAAHLAEEAEAAESPDGAPARRRPALRRRVRTPVDAQRSE
jgi:hypothetical protein